MRLFVGVELSDGVRERASAATTRLRTRLHDVCPRLSARWIEPDNFHITLWFLGEVHDDRIDAVTRAVEAPFEAAPFELTLAGLGAFPPRGAPRVFWIGVSHGQQALRLLHEQLDPRLTALGFRAEQRAYSAHLTIGRVKDVPRACVSGVRSALGGNQKPVGSCQIDHVTLFRSRLSPRGSRYEPLLRVALKR
jgi:RNA 2',3'-cyclic 3'-phosphodiesterase